MNCKLLCYLFIGSIIFTSSFAQCPGSCTDDIDCEDDPNSSCSVISNRCNCNSGYYRTPSCDNCTNSSNCTTSKDCEGRGGVNTVCEQICRCKSSYYVSPETNLCTRGIESSCNNEQECLDRVGNSVCNSGQCTCKPGYYILGDNCVPILMSYCDASTDCTSKGDPWTICDLSERLCVCRQGFYQPDQEGLCTEVYDSACSSDDECKSRNDKIPDDNAVCSAAGNCQCGNSSARAPRDSIYQCQTLEFGMQCEIGQICLSLDPHTVCVSGQCACDEQSDWMLNQTLNQCVYQIDLGEECDLKSNLERCKAENAECKRVGFHSECTCVDGYFDLPLSNGTRICVRQLSRVQDAECKQCEDNRGRCYDLNGDGTKNGCQCPNTRSGQDCQTIHTKVSCTKDTMNVCYEPHDGVDLTTGFMYAVGFSGDDRCIAISDDAVCEAGNYRLSLPIGNSSESICGMKLIEDSTTSYKYQTTLVVQEKRHVQDAGDRVFPTYCRFVTYVQGSAGIGIGGWPGTGEGEDKDPRLTMFVRNARNEMIPRGVALKIGDRIKLDLFLYDETNTYDGIKVRSCFASTDPVLPHPNAIILPLIDDGCPSPGQEHITVANNFKRVGGEPNHLQTGLFNVFRLSRGTALFLHCEMDVCLDEESCKAENCGPRADSTERMFDSSGTAVSLVGELIIYDPDAEISGLNQTQTIIIGVCGGSTVVAVAMAAVFGARLRRHKNAKKTSEETSERDYTTWHDNKTFHDRAYNNYNDDFFKLQRTSIDSINT